MMRHKNPGKEFNALRADVDRLRSDIGNLSGSVHHVASRRARDLSDGMHDRADHMRRGVRNVQARGMQAKNSAEHAIADRPFSTTLVAFGLGFAVATLCGAASRAYRRRQLAKPHRVPEDELDTL